MKYLHQRLLVVLVSPPLPGISTQHGHRTHDTDSKRRGFRGEDGSESDGSGDEGSSIGSAISSTGSGIDGDGRCSHEDLDCKSQFFL